MKFLQACSIRTGVSCSLRSVLLKRSRSLISITINISSFKMSTNTRSGDNFQLRKALVLTKFSRYEFEKRRNPELTDEQLHRNLSKRGSDVSNLIHHHGIHTKSRDHVVKCLRDSGIDTKVVNRFDYKNEDIKWADAIFTAGGDGTFLMAASRITDPMKPVIGINSDPDRSVGHLCLPSAFSDNFMPALNKILANDFKWKSRQRIRVTVEGENSNDEPIELHDQQLQHPEYRFLDLEPRTPEESTKSPMVPVVIKSQILPIRALNEVFVGETLSSRVSYYELEVDNEPFTKMKSSGLTVSTGTGSTSWSFNINKLTTQCVQKLVNILEEETNKKLQLGDKMIEHITKKFNDSLIFDPSMPSMAYTIRDPIVFGTGFHSDPRGFAKRIRIKSRMYDACIVLDGGLSYTFNDGALATLEILPEDALLTVEIEL